MLLKIGLNTSGKDEIKFNKTMSVLSIVATPIGNLEDITLRALRILREADFILCEDTRVTKKLLNVYKINTPTISYHQHSGRFKIDKIIELLRADKKIALVADAGTPGISDPGSFLVSSVRQELKGEVIIECIPGPSALTAALSLVGQGFDRFLFLGFLPHKKGRQTLIKEIVNSSYPVVLYESKHRLIKLLTELETFSALNRKSQRIFLAKELTKIHETLYEGLASELRKKLQSKEGNLKGEFVVLINNLL